MGKHWIIETFTEKKDKFFAQSVKQYKRTIKTLQPLLGNSNLNYNSLIQ